MSMQMTSRGVKNDFDEMLRRKREMESTAKALHIELQNALLLCSKMEEVGNFRSPLLIVLLRGVAFCIFTQIRRKIKT